MSAGGAMMVQSRATTTTATTTTTTTTTTMRATAAAREKAGNESVASTAMNAAAMSMSSSNGAKTARGSPVCVLKRTQGTEAGPRENVLIRLPLPAPLVKAKVAPKNEGGIRKPSQAGAVATAAGRRRFARQLRTTRTVSTRNLPIVLPMQKL